MDELRLLASSDVFVSVVCLFDEINMLAKKIIIMGGRVVGQSLKTFKIILTKKQGSDSQPLPLIFLPLRLIDLVNADRTGHFICNGQQWLSGWAILGCNEFETLWRVVA